MIYTVVDRSSSHYFHAPTTTSLNLLFTGTQNTECDPITGHCKCLPGVSGFLCDRCSPGYWGFGLITRGSSGCTRKSGFFYKNIYIIYARAQFCKKWTNGDILIRVFFFSFLSFSLPACLCSPFGSVRSDCEQNTGRCVCKPGILGAKCDTCPNGDKVTSSGCEGRKFCGCCYDCAFRQMRSLSRSQYLWVTR